MSYGDTQRADETALRDRITVTTDAGDRVTGKVVELALHGDKYETILITILAADPPRLVRIRRTPDAPIEYEGVGRRDRRL